MMCFFFFFKGSSFCLQAAFNRFFGNAVTVQGFAASRQEVEMK